MVSETVYVIGAGFSRGVGIPASKEFVSSKEFKYLKKKLKANSYLTKKIQNLQSYVQFRLDNKYCDKNIESVLNHVATAKYLDMESMTENFNYSADDIFDDLLWYIARLIKEKTLDINTKILDAYQTFLNSVYDNRETIITFNYDILLETVLISLGYGYRYGIDEKKSNYQLSGTTDLYSSVMGFYYDTFLRYVSSSWWT